MRGLTGSDSATSIGVTNDSMAQRFAAHNAGDLRAFSPALRFIRAKEKDPVFYDGTADSASKGIADQLSGTVGKTRLDLRALVKPVVGGGNSRAIVFVERAVEIVGAALGHQIYLRAGRAAAIGIGLAGDDAKFLQGIQSGAQRALKREAESLIVVVNPIQGNVGLIAAGTAD